MGDLKLVKKFEVKEGFLAGMKNWSRMWCFPIRNGR